MVKKEYIDKLVSIQGFSVAEMLFGQYKDEPVLIILLNRNETIFEFSCVLEYTILSDDLDFDAVLLGKT